MDVEGDLFAFQERYKDCFVPLLTNNTVHVFCYNNHNFKDYRPLAPIVYDPSEVRKIQKTAEIVRRCE
jgi:hypothetical protein